jgi:hypothetical protein
MANDSSIEQGCVSRVFEQVLLSVANVSLPANGALHVDGEPKVLIAIIA